MGGGIPGPCMGNVGGLAGEGPEGTPAGPPGGPPWGPPGGPPVEAPGAPMVGGRAGGIGPLPGIIPTPPGSGTGGCIGAGAPPMFIGADEGPLASPGAPTRPPGTGLGAPAIVGGSGKGGKGMPAKKANKQAF